MVVCTFGTVQFVDAATISFDSSLPVVHVGDTVTVHVQVDTERQTLNAIESTVVFPSNLLTYESADDGDSVLSLWVQKPTLVGTSQIHFSGFTPGGFVDTHAPLLTLTFKVIAVGQGTLVFNDTSLLLHDGSGTEASVKKLPLEFNVGAGVPTAVVPTPDTELPEHFVPEILNDPDVFEGHTALIFATSDKGSGMDHFEIREGWWGKYERVQSPYEIKHQALDTELYIRAIDRAGNVRQEIFYPHNWCLWYKAPKIIGTIVVICVLLFGLVWIAYRRMWCRYSFSW